MPRSALPGLWQYFGINVGNDINFNWGGGRGWPSDAVGQARVQADVAFLVNTVGIKYFRVAAATLYDTHGLAQVRYEVTTLLSYPGVTVQYGLNPQSSIATTAGQNQFVSDCISEAKWAQAAGVQRFQVGNELALSSGLSLSAAYTFQQTIPAQLRGYFSGKITASESQNYFSQWSTNGIGNYDDLGLDIYGAGSDLTGITNYPDFVSQTASAKTALGSNVFLSEWACNASACDLYKIDNEAYRQGMRLRLAYIKANFTRPCYMFTWRFDDTNVQDLWAAMTNPGNIRPFFYDMIGQRSPVY